MPLCRLRVSPTPYGFRSNSGSLVALHYMHYNFCRIHKTRRITPAMAAGVTDHVWTVADIVAMIEANRATAS
jgi:hypothetical protein